MGFIDRNLMDGEQMVYRARLHWAIFLWQIVLVVVLAMAAIVVAVVATDKRLAYIPLVLLGVAILSGLGKYVRYLSTEFGVTTHRVLVKTGLLTIRSTEVLLPKVEAVQIEQSIGGRLLNYGTITITGTGGTHEVFPLVEAPYELRNQVQQQLSRPQQPTPTPPVRRYD